MKLKCLAIAITTVLMGCNGSSSDLATSQVSFSVSDAPVDNASVVMIAFDKIELVPESGDSILFDVDPDGVLDYQQVDLLTVQGTEVKQILAGYEVPVGNYQNLILHIEPGAGLNYVVDQSGNQALKQPSNKLKLGSFSVAAQPTQAFTIEFDLRQSLVMRGNQGNNNGYILKPHGVTIVSSSIAASLGGSVDASLFNAGVCTYASGNFVYLYSGHGLDPTALIDMVDPDDETYTSTLPVGAVAPYTSAAVNVDTFQYQIGNLPPGDYTAAFSCSADADDPVNLDGLTIPDPAAKAPVEVTLANSEAGNVSFGPITP